MGRRWRAAGPLERALSVPSPGGKDPLALPPCLSHPAHIGICTIDLPPYSTYPMLRRAVHTALSMGCVGFDDAAVADGGGARDDRDGDE